MIYHGQVRGPNGQIYQCEHNHRTETAAVTCANSPATRRMAAIAWNRAAVRAAQAAALAKKREEECAAVQARRIAAREASEARRAASEAAAQEAKAAKRAAKLAAMKPRRAWKRMTPAERLLRTADLEMQVYGEIISPEAQAGCAGRSEGSQARLRAATAEADRLSDRATAHQKAAGRDDVPIGDSSNSPAATSPKERGHADAYEALIGSTLTFLEAVETTEGVGPFVMQAARQIREQSASIPEFYTGVFINMLKDAVVERCRIEAADCEQAVRAAKEGAATATDELQAHLAAARAAHDPEAEHAVWRDRDTRQAACQAKLDAVTKRAGMLSLRLSAFQQLSSAVGFDLG
jgi:hypothetical protein